LKGDFDLNNCIDRANLDIILAGIRSTASLDDPKLDVNGDGFLNIADARKLVMLFTNPRGAACQPEGVKFVH